MGGFARVVGPTTPVGGLLMISGYLSLVSRISARAKSGRGVELICGRCSFSERRKAKLKLLYGMMKYRKLHRSALARD